MNYRVELYETFDSNGVSIVNLSVELDGQIYSSSKRFINEKDRQEAIAACFEEVSLLLKGK